jgi:DNA-binding transcriptional LysR family regulator
MANMRWADRIGRRLKLRDLHVLSAVVQWGSMAKAARHLAVSQPVVSAAIADLEHAVGVRLLDRSRQGIEPTIYGRALLKHGGVAFDALKQGIDEIEFLADPTAGELRIGCPEWIAAGLLPAVIDRILQKHPRIVFHVDQTITATRDFRELRQRSLDLVLGWLATPFTEEDLHADVLYQDEPCVVAGARSPWSRRRKIELAELVDEAWQLSPLNEAQLRASGMKIARPKIMSYSYHLRGSLLHTGRYLSVVPRSLLQFGGLRTSLKVLPVKLPIEPRPVAIVTLKGRTLSPVASLFIECAREIAKPLAKGQASSGRAKNISAHNS